MRTPSFPQTIKSESQSVVIYKGIKTKQGKDGPVEYTEFTLVYYQDRKRKREASADYAALRVRADEVLDDLKTGRTDPGAISAALRQDVQAAMVLLGPTGQRLLTAVTHYVEAYNILGSDLVIAAAREYKKRHANTVSILVSEAVDKLLDEKEKAKRSNVHVSRLKTHLEAFGDAFAMNLDKVSASDMDRFLDGLKNGDADVSPRTRKNYADSIVTLYKWAKRKRHVPADYDEETRITRLENDHDGAIEIYTPDELNKFLKKTDSKLIPFLVIGAFAGLRSSEIMRLDWADVKIENGSSNIVVQQGKVKKRGKSRRIVPMSENLKAWLSPHVKQSGPVWEFSVPYLYEALRDLAKETKIEWKNNALRHSYISYRVAKVKNVSEVALECGNSPQMIFSNYREIVTEQDAMKWFEIMPAK